uniref:Uncharacterized protein n=1 Tax=Leviviridae sp. TaxID=2027243 RepID=A0A514D7D3_9VIRU|nr:MAG: hypothetical protein H4Bulk465285_000001 [Leviviridae sp.]
MKDSLSVRQKVPWDLMPYSFAINFFPEVLPKRRDRKTLRSVKKFAAWVSRTYR